MFESACSESLDPARTRNSRDRPCRERRDVFPSIVDYVRIKNSRRRVPAAIVIRFDVKEIRHRGIFKAFERFFQRREIVRRDTCYSVNTWKGVPLYHDVLSHAFFHVTSGFAECERTRNIIVPPPPYTHLSPC